MWWMGGKGKIVLSVVCEQITQNTFLVRSSPVYMGQSLISLELVYEFGK